jgi:cyanophycin synthetase
MKVKSTKTFPGVNFYTTAPAVAAEVDLGEFEGLTSREIVGLNDRLVAALPMLQQHACALPKSVPFPDVLTEGVDLRHVLVHVTWALFNRLTPIGVQHFECRPTRTPTDRVVIETRSGEVTRYLLRESVQMLNDLVNGRPVDMAEVLSTGREILHDTELGLSGRCIVEEAEKRGIPWTRENDRSLVQLGYGRNLQFVQAAVTSRTSSLASDLVSNKNQTKEVLERFSIPVPKGFVVQSEEEAVQAFERIGAPVVLKPLNGNQGKGVSLDLASVDEVVRAYGHAREYSSRVIVEKMLSGKNYRVLVVDGKMVAASERRGVCLTGDGRSTIEELIRRENENPLRGEGHEKPLTKIRLSNTIMSGLAGLGWSLTDILEDGREIEIPNTMNLSTGGSAKDVTDEVHTSVRMMCERAARVVNLDINGVDLMLDDISRPVSEQPNGGIIEMNSGPGLRMHVHPSDGTPRDVCGAIIDMLYPNDAPSRIPIIAITGTNGKTTVTRLTSHILQRTGKNIGTTTTDGIMLNGESIVFGDTTGPASAKTVLGDKLVDIAVLETARGGLLRRGLGWDWCDIGVVLNITEDHIGQDGINSVKDLVENKSLIAERVRAGGTVVLNADDPESSALAHRPAVAQPQRRIVYFSTQESSPIVEAHLLGGGTAYLLRNGMICEAAGDSVLPIMNPVEVPITINGTAEYQIQNVMAAVAVARAMEMEPVTIAAALETFSGGRDNRGRTNIYRVGDGCVILDYGHNPKAIESICGMISQWGMKRTGIISFPGDRRDEVIEASTRATAKGFDKIVIKGDKDLRGRREGEVAEMMLRVIRENGGPEQTSIELDANQAFERHVASIAPNEVVVFFYEKLDPVLEILARYKAVAADDANFLTSASNGQKRSAATEITSTTI